MIRTDVWCTNCQRRFLAELDLEINGNHQITCPLCQHVHYRVVRDGIVTEDRWRSSAGPTIIASTSTISSGFSITTNSTTTSGNYFLSNSWINGTDISL